MVRFDKTGTLTTGRPRVECLAVRGAQAEPILLAVAHASSHPLARALVEHLEARPVAGKTISRLASRTIPGRGVEATLSHRDRAFGATLGEPDWLVACGAACPAALQDVARAAEREGAPRMALACEGRIQAVATFSEQLRCGAAEAIRWLQQQGYAPAVLSGDRAARASVVGRALQIAVADGQSPDDKAEALAALARRGHRVAMVGDGINDAPALATAYIGVALADGADLARETAGVCLLGDDLRRLPEALELARRTVRVVRQNLFWALVYNVVGIGFAVAGWLNPVVAAAAMVASSALVLANSLRLRGDDSMPRRTAQAVVVESSRDDEAPTGTTPLDICAELEKADHPVEAHA